MTTLLMVGSEPKLTDKVPVVVWCASAVCTKPGVPVEGVIGDVACTIKYEAPQMDAKSPARTVMLYFRIRYKDVSSNAHRKIHTNIIVHRICLKRCACGIVKHKTRRANQGVNSCGSYRTL